MIMKKTKIKREFIVLDDSDVYGLLYLSKQLLLINKNFDGKCEIIYIRK